jgi:hypothetical protein
MIRQGSCFSEKRRASSPSEAERVEKPSFCNELVINEEIIASSSTVKMGFNKPFFFTKPLPLATPVDVDVEL